MYGNYYSPYPQGYYNPAGAVPDTLTQFKNQYQPMPMSPAQSLGVPVCPANDMLWVLGEVEATSYPVAPNNTVVLWDKDQHTVYVKSVNAQGVPSMRILDYAERNSSAAKKVEHECQCAGKFAKAEDLKALEEKFLELQDEIMAKSKRSTKEEIANG